MENGISEQASTQHATAEVRRTFYPSERMTPEIRQRNQAIHEHERQSGEYASQNAMSYFQAMAAMMIQ